MKSHDEENIFYHKTDDGTRLEIDFLIQRNGKLLPIEVKAEGNVRAKYCQTRVIYLNLAYRN